MSCGPMQKTTPGTPRGCSREHQGRLNQGAEVSMRRTLGGQVGAAPQIFPTCPHPLIPRCGAFAEPHAPSALMEAPDNSPGTAASALT